MLTYKNTHKKIEGKSNINEIYKIIEFYRIKIIFIITLKKYDNDNSCRTVVMVGE